MTKSESPTDANDTSPDAPPAALDLSRYRTSELVGILVDLVGVPHAIRRVVLVTVVLGAAFCATTGTVFYQATLSRIGWLVLCAYSLAAGFGLGMILGFLRVLSRALASIEGLLKLTLTITENAADDFARLQSGAARMPSAGVLVEQVHEDVLVPTLEVAISRAFGSLSRPLLWLYPRSIGVAVRFLIKKMARTSTASELGEAAVKATTSQVGALARYPEYIKDYTKHAAELVNRVSRKIRVCATLPLYIAFFVCLLTAFVPVIALRFFATGEPPN